MEKILLERFTKKNCQSKIKVELDLSNYPTKYDLKNTTGADTLKFFKNFDSANLKSDIHKLDIGKLETITAYLSKLSNAVEKEVVKKGAYDELVKKIGAIQTDNLVDKADYDAQVKEVEDKMADDDRFITT